MGPASWCAILRIVSLSPYLEIARADHWVKNAFMLLGVLLAVFYRPDVFAVASLRPLLLAIAATCLVASSNYVLNELLDAPQDRAHPEKRHRPVPSGQVRPVLGYAEWLLLAIAGFALALIGRSLRRRRRSEAAEPEAPLGPKSS